VPGGYRYKPSKPVGALSVVVGIGMLVFGVLSFRDVRGTTLAFIVFWCCAVVAITALNAWAAFSKEGSLATFLPVGRPSDDRDDAS
jgi:hypothetical protein